METSRSPYSANSSEQLSKISPMSKQQSVKQANTPSQLNSQSISTQSSGLVISSRIDQLMALELASAQRLLAIQQKDNYKFQEHVQLLDGEIDALKELLEAKQLLINKKESEIDIKCEQVRNLEMELKAARLDIASFATLAENHRTLQQALENKQIEIEKLMLKLSVVEKNRDEMEQYWKLRIEESLEKEAQLVASVGLLTRDLNEAKDKKDEAGKLIKELRSNISSLQQELKFVDETRAEMVGRSRQTEYLTLLKADGLSNQLQRVKDEKETIQQTLDLSLFRGDILQQRLTESFEITDENHHVMETVIKSLEQANAEAKNREKLLVMENENLQARLAVAQKAVIDLTHKLVHADEESSIADDATRASRSSAKAGSFKSFGSTAYQAHRDSSRVSSLPLVVSASSKSVTPRLSTEVIRLKKTTDKGASDVNEIIGQHSVGVVVVGEELQLRGKSRMIMQHLKLFGYVIRQHLREPLHSENNVVLTLDLSSMGLLDADVKIVVDELRSISFTVTSKIDLSKNMITNSSVELLALWLIALPDEEYECRRQTGPLYIDLRYNMINAFAIKRCVSLLKSVPRPQVVLTVFEEEEMKVCLYGPLHKSNIKASMIPIVYIDFRHNEPKKKLPKNQRLNAIGPIGSGPVDSLPFNNIRDNVDLRPSTASILSLPGGVADARDWYKGTGDDGVVYPSNGVLRYT